MRASSGRTNAKVVKGHSLGAQLLAAGEVDALVSAYAHHIDNLAADDAPVAWTPPVEPVILRQNGVAVLQDAQHPAAAALFVERLSGRVRRPTRRAGTARPGGRRRARRGDPVIDEERLARERDGGSPAGASAGPSASPPTSSAVPRLWALRHAKSSGRTRPSPTTTVPLAPRGQRACRALRRHCSTAAVLPELVLCSSAVRARETLEALLPVLGDRRSWSRTASTSRARTPC